MSRFCFDEELHIWWPTKWKEGVEILSFSCSSGAPVSADSKYWHYEEHTVSPPWSFYGVCHTVCQKPNAFFYAFMNYMWERSLCNQANKNSPSFNFFISYSWNLCFFFYRYAFCSPEETCDLTVPFSACSYQMRHLEATGIFLLHKTTRDVCAIFRLSQSKSHARPVKCEGDACWSVCLSH